MSLSDRINRDINSLVKPHKTGSILKGRAAAAEIAAQRGLGEPGSVDAGVSIKQRKQILAVFSTLILTEDGAFEKPANWPTSGAYPAGTPIPAPLPPSLINNAGTLSLDVDVLYYEQKRVHIASFFDGSDIIEDVMYVALAAPFEGLGYYLGTAKYSQEDVPIAFYAEGAATGMAAVQEYLNDVPYTFI